MSIKAYRVAPWRAIIRPLMRGSFQLIFRVLARVRIYGKRNIPKQQSYVVAMNHVSLYDPPFMLAFFPQVLEAMGAVDIWHKPGQDILVRLYGGIPVHRGEYDRKLIDTVVSILESGFPLLIAPEGGRSHEPAMRKAKAGIALIIDRVNVPVVPVGIVGTTDDFWRRATQGERPRLEMHIGEPLILPRLKGSGEERRQARQNNADLVMSHIADLLPEEYRGVYRDGANHITKTGK